MDTTEFRKYLRRHLASNTADLSDELMEHRLVAGMLQVMAETAVEVRQENEAISTQWLWEWWQTPALTVSERAILIYYYPLRTNIQDDLELISQCLSTAFSVQVRIDSSIKQEASRLFDGFVSGVSFWDVDTIAGGEAIDDRPKYEIKIGPIENEQLSEWLENGRKKWFIETHLMPLLLLKGSRFNVVIIPETDVDCATSETVASHLEVNFSLA